MINRSIKTLLSFNSNEGCCLEEEAHRHILELENRIQWLLRDDGSCILQGDPKSPLILPGNSVSRCPLQSSCTRSHNKLHSDPTIKHHIL